MSNKNHKIRVAAAQLPGLPLDQAYRSLEAISEAISDAAAIGADLLVLPECAYPAYCLGSADNYRNSSPLDNSTLLAKLSELAATNNINIVCGFVEDTGTALSNAAIVIDSSGQELGRHRKTFLWGEDNVYFERGQTITPIDTPVGRIGVVICAEGRAPEIAAGMVAQGAQLIVLPTCWVNVAEQLGQFSNAQAEYMAQARAIECGIPVVAANKFGAETDDVSYCGMSMIVDGQGDSLAIAPPDAAALIHADIDLAPPDGIDLPTWTTTRLFSNEPAITPQEDQTESIRLAVIPGNLASNLGDDDERDLLHHIAENDVRVIATCFENEDFADRMEVYGRTLGITVIGYPFIERLMIESFGSYGCIHSASAISFAPTRTLALDGASLVIITGSQLPISLLRTRAAENRIFVAAAGPEFALLIAPGGRIIDSCDSSKKQPLVHNINLAETANKLAYPNTHIWEQRLPRSYAHAFDF